MKRGDPNFGTTPSSQLIYERHREYRKKSKNTHRSDENIRKRQSANRPADRSMSVAFPRFNLYAPGCQVSPIQNQLFFRGG